MSARRRYRIGRDLVVVEVTEHKALLEGVPRLEPGQIVMLADVPCSQGVEERAATVDSWAVARLGNNGTVYRGVCTWVESRGEHLQA